MKNWLQFVKLHAARILYLLQGRLGYLIVIIIDRIVTSLFWSLHSVAQRKRQEKLHDLWLKENHQCKTFKNFQNMLAFVRLWTAPLKPPQIVSGSHSFSRVFVSATITCTCSAFWLVHALSVFFDWQDTTFTKTQLKTALHPQKRTKWSKTETNRKWRHLFTHLLHQLHVLNGSLIVCGLCDWPEWLLW